MDRISTIRMLADYNRSMNQRIYEVAARLPVQDLTTDRRAFFGSILGTLNHLAVGDTIWLGRFAQLPSKYAALEPVRELPTPTSLDQVLFADFRALSAYRTKVDEIIVRWASEVDEKDLDGALEYKSMKGVHSTKSLFGLLMHFFNHQTHHRGQVSTLLMQAGQDIGITDLLMWVEEESA